jgi:ubiquitin-protein ligase
MSAIRLRRISSDQQLMQQLADSSDLIKVETAGHPPDRYVITYSCYGLIWNEDSGQPAKSKHFKIEIVLHAEYPKKRPGLRILTPIFHPNFVNSGICTGHWTPATSLDNLCIQIGRMIQYRNYDIGDCLDTHARDWAKDNAHLLPVDRRDFIRSALEVIS